MGKTFNDLKLGEVRKLGYTGLKIYCTRCHYENVVMLKDIPASRDRWPLNWMSYPHESCPAKGSGLVRVTVV